VLGSQAFVEGQLAAYRARTGRRERTGVRPLPPVTDWGGLATLRGLRRCAFGLAPRHRLISSQAPARGLLP
jgi:hypothetical protein